MKPVYDKIGSGYARSRRTDPRIASEIQAALTGARRVLNIGAGTGSYEPEGIKLVALEPSAAMVSQRPPGMPAVRAFAEQLPFASDSFSHAMTILSMHHWHDRVAAYREINRVATSRFVALTWNPEAPPFWLTRDYFPSIDNEDIRIFPRLDELECHFDEVQMQPVMVPDDCLDGFLAAFWKRPQAYLDAGVRKSISPFALLENLSEGLARLQRDMDSGAWRERNQDLLRLQSLDVGYVLVTASIRKS